MLTPILFIGFCRKEFLLASINNLRDLENRHMYISVDVPFTADSNKLIMHNELMKEIRNIDNVKIDIIYNKVHKGLKKNVEDAVEYVLTKHKSIIVVEDDVIIDIDGIKLFDELIERYEYEKKVAHISIYNRVPPSQILNIHEIHRFSQIPETYVWATWTDRWANYEKNIASNLKKIKFSDLKSKTGSFLGAITWKIHLWEAKVGLVDSWAYRWLLTIWVNNQFCITANKNYVQYFGHLQGTHVHTVFGKKQLNKSSVEKRVWPTKIEIDQLADRWTLKHDAFGSLFRLPFKLIQTVGSILIFYRKKFSKVLPNNKRPEKDK